jgi:hypothetical protein
LRENPALFLRFQAITLMSPILFWLFLPFIRGEGSRETLYDIFVCNARRLCAFNSWNFSTQARVRISVSMQRAGLLLQYTDAFSPRLCACACCRSPAGVRCLFEPFVYKCDFFTKKARDKHRESSLKRPFCAGGVCGAESKKQGEGGELGGNLLAGGAGGEEKDSNPL